MYVGLKEMLPVASRYAPLAGVCRVGAEGAVAHCAYNVTEAVNGYVAPLAYAVPEPSAAVFQPANVWPEYVNELDVNAVAVAAV